MVDLLIFRDPEAKNENTMSWTRQDRIVEECWMLDQVFGNSSRSDFPCGSGRDWGGRELHEKAKLTEKDFSQIVIGFEKHKYNDTETEYAPTMITIFLKVDCLRSKENFEAFAKEFASRIKMNLDYGTPWHSSIHCPEIWLVEHSEHDGYLEILIPIYLREDIALKLRETLDCIKAAAQKLGVTIDLT